MAQDLRLIGITHPKELINKNPYALYNELCRKTGEKRDPCVIEVFLAVVDFMEGGGAAPWWDFTEERKKHLSATYSPSSASSISINSN